MDNYQQATVKTVQQLREVARTVSKLSLPEIEQHVDLIGRLIPAGNVPGVVLNGLARLKGRPLPERTRQDIDTLFMGVEQFLDKAVYLGVFAGPAMIIWGYQKMLMLAGKNPEEAFPEGTWQYYVEYALREDTARHANETHGFDSTLNEHRIVLNPVDRMAAWVMAAIQILHQYDRILENEWRERVYTCLLREDAVYHEWEKQRPYGRGHDAAHNDDYPTYRRLKFDHFLEAYTRKLSHEKRRAWEAEVRAARESDLPAYQRQMGMLATLVPEYYHETRTLIPLEKVHIGVIYQGQYYLIPACKTGTAFPADIHTVRSQLATILYRPAEHPRANLTPLAKVRRAEFASLKLSIAKGLESLCLAPILINFDLRPRDIPLAELRQAERGVGSHAMTLFDTGETMVFDLSHIFFDGTFGAALAEIFTNEALAWAVYLSSLPPAMPQGQRPYSPHLALTESDRKKIENVSTVAAEVSAETDAINFRAIYALRKLFKRRNDLLQLTVNDLLLLYRAIHAATYKPNPALKEQVSPATMIPVDASPRSPRDRVYPMSFEVPLKELGLVRQHKKVLQALDAYENATDDRQEKYEKFDVAQRHYLAMLAAFGQLMTHAKQIALAGESASVGTIKFLAHLPKPLQKMLDEIPAHFDVLNDIIKGREVFSNVGMVAPGSSLTRFITAKDDNEKKTLAWSVITDDNGVMRMALRDFRPHVRQLIEDGQRELAVEIVREMLDAYARGLNQYINDLYRITAASRETRHVENL